LLPGVRAIDGLRPAFWIEQGERVLECELGTTWAETFWNEAIALSEKMTGEDSPATVLLTIFEMAFHNDAEALAKQYAQQVRNRYAACGASDYVDAVYAFNPDERKNTRTLAALKTAEAKAIAAGESGVAALAREFRDFIHNPIPKNLFGMGAESIFELLANFEKEGLDVPRRRR
jgi:hypothetical protein